MKKTLLFYVAVVFTVVTSFAQQTFTSGGLNFQISDTDNPRATVTGRASGNTATNITIPATAIFNGTTYAVTSIGNFAFQNNALESVLIFDGLTSIGLAAFQNNDLKSVAIPASVTSIGDNAFRNNALESVDIPDGVTSIGNGAFIANNLRSVDIPEGITSIGDNAFRNNDLKSVDIPDGVTSIGNGAFSFNNLESLVIPDGVTSIGVGAFENNDLRSVVILASVTSIGESAFAGNLMLTSITSLSTNPATIDNFNDPFSSFFAGSNRSSINLTIPFGTRETYNQRGWTGFKSIEEGVSFTDQGFTFTELSATEVVVTGKAEENTATDITIPETTTFNDTTYTVISIGVDAFEENFLASVVIPASVTSIGDFAFSQNALGSVDIPASVTSIGRSAFERNMLQSVDIPTSVTSIGRSAFERNMLQSVDIPASVTSIGIDAFRNNDLTSVVIPASVRSIGRNAFLNNALESVVIPDGVTSIGNGAFRDNALASVVIPASVTSISDFVFADNPLTSVVIPASVTSIGDFAFSQNALGSVVIPASVRSIGIGAFAGNPLTSVTSLSTNPVNINDTDPFRNLDRSDITLTIPFGTRETYNEGGWTGFSSVEEGVSFTDQGFTFTELSATEVVVTGKAEENTATDITIPATATFNGTTYTVISIGDNAFRDNALESVVIPDGVTSIGSSAFRDNALESVVIPANVTSIGNFAFSANRLTSVVIPASVTSIASFAFRDNALRSVVIPASVTSIASFAFRDNALESVVIPDGVTSIGFSAFSNNALESVVIPASVRSIGSSAFSNNALESVVIPASVRSIGNGAFSNNALESVVIPASVTNIDRSAFAENPLTFVTSLRTNPVNINDTDPFRNLDRSDITLTIPFGTRETYNQRGWTGFKSIEEGVSFTDQGFTFTELSATEVVVTGKAEENTATDITIPATATFNGTVYNVISIGTAAFESNNLTTLDIPASVTSIGASAFQNNPLTSITSLSTNPVDINNSDPFSNLTRSSITLNIPFGTREIYNERGWTGFSSVEEGVSFTDQGFTFTELSATEVVVTGKAEENTATDITIPATATFNGTTYTVISIGNFAFSANRLTSVVIPANVTSIGDSAFQNNALESVVIPDSVTSIGSTAFFNNALESVVIPDGVRSIRSSAFSNNALESVVIPDGVRNIGLFAFRNNALESVVIPASVTSIGRSAFADNPLTSITSLSTNPATIDNNNNDPLFSSSALDIERSRITLTILFGTREIYNQRGWTGFTIVEGVSFTDQGFTFTELSTTEVVVTSKAEENTATDITIPATATFNGTVYNVISIGTAAFESNNLTTLDIPASVTSIGATAFQNNPLTSITSLSTNPVDINNSDPFSNITRSSITLNIPFGTREIYNERGWTGFNSVEEGLRANTFVTWSGATDNNWETASNWLEGVVPNIISDVMIPNTGVTNYPTISFSVTVNSITIASGASLIANAAVTAPVTYTRNLPTTNWYLVSAPVAGETQQDIIANSTTFAMGTGGNIGIGAFQNNTGPAWVFANNATTDNLTTGSGISMKLNTPGDVIIAGAINVTNVRFPVATGTRNNFNLIGNPFTSYINSATLANNNSVIENATFWLWDGSQYTVHNKANPINIAPAQGFFVEANSNTNITFDINNQSHQTTDTFQKTTPTPSFELFVENGDNKRATKVFYIEGKTTGFDSGYDSKIFGGVAQSFGVFTHLVADNDGSKLAIQTLPNSNLNEMVIPVGVIAQAGTEVTFSLETSNFSEAVNVYLEDRINNTFTDITAGNTTVTVAEVANNVGQFYIHTQSKSLSTNTQTTASISIYASSKSEITVTGLQGKANVTLFSLLGKQMVSKQINSNGNSTILLPNLPTGVYIANLQTSTGTVTKKIIIE